nr:immunoglobulin heavy chain junction region [Mus musculus]
ITVQGNFTTVVATT